LIDSYFLKNETISSLNVSRETFNQLEDYSNEIIKKNKQINLVSKNTESVIKSRHIEDSAQIIDFINKDDIKVCTDIGSGAGLPGIVIGILMKSKKPLFKVIFYEKSHHKSSFIKKMTKKFEIKSEVHKKNIFNQKNLNTDVIISRAFKPLPIIFEIANKNFKNYKYIVLFLGKSGKKLLIDSFKKWKFDYVEKKSLTSEESFIVKISNLKKING
tara:strand:+ start:1798 stop:2442 length:645 start_codon:yes stop_codon:yes gene_type:complete